VHPLLWGLGDARGQDGVIQAENIEHFCFGEAIARRCKVEQAGMHKRQWMALLQRREDGACQNLTREGRQPRFVCRNIEGPQHDGSDRQTDRSIA